MRKEALSNRPAGRCARTAVALAAGLALGWTCLGNAFDRQPNAAGDPDARQRIVDLEKIFWQCERAAGAGMLDAATAAQCDAVTDELRKRKFGGDSERLLQWWQQNRIALRRSIEVNRGAKIEA